MRGHDLFLFGFFDKLILISDRSPLKTVSYYKLPLINRNVERHSELILCIRLCAK